MTTIIKRQPTAAKVQQLQQQLQDQKEQQEQLINQITKLTLQSEEQKELIHSITIELIHQKQINDDMAKKMGDMGGENKSEDKSEPTPKEVMRPAPTLTQVLDARRQEILKRPQHEVQKTFKTQQPRDLCKRCLTTQLTNPFHYKRHIASQHCRFDYNNIKDIYTDQERVIIDDDEELIRDHQVRGSKYNKDRNLLLKIENGQLPQDWNQLKQE